MRANGRFTDKVHEGGGGRKIGYVFERENNKVNEEEEWDVI